MGKSYLGGLIWSDHTKIVRAAVIIDFNFFHNLFSNLGPKNIYSRRFASQKTLFVITLQKLQEGRVPPSPPHSVPVKPLLVGDVNFNPGLLVGGGCFSVDVGSKMSKGLLIDGWCFCLGAAYRWMGGGCLTSLRSPSWWEVNFGEGDDPQALLTFARS